MRTAATVAATLMALTACGGSGSPDPAAADSPPATPPAPVTPVAPTGSPGLAGEPDFNDPCSLLTQPELATVFNDGVPEPESNSYGAGFAECVWEDSAEQVVRLSVVPPENLQSDYVDQLVILEDTVALGEGSVAFPGVVGIGHARSGGVTGGFTAAESGVLLAVKTGDGTDQTADLDPRDRARPAAAVPDPGLRWRPRQRAGPARQQVTVERRGDPLRCEDLDRPVPPCR
jgi:hypothetical protein